MSVQFDPILGDVRDGAVSLAEQLAGFNSGTTAQQAAFQSSVSGEYIATANVGVIVTDGTMSVRLPSAGNKSLQFMIATSETASYISELKSNTYTIGLLDAQTTIAGGWQYCSPTTNIGSAGVVQEVYISLISSARFYKLIMVIGGGYNNNIFVIKRIK